MDRLLFLCVRLLQNAATLVTYLPMMAPSRSGAGGADARSLAGGTALIAVPVYVAAERWSGFLCFMARRQRRSRRAAEHAAKAPDGSPRATTKPDVRANLCRADHASRQPQDRSDFRHFALSGMKRTNLE
jgi:hypothetical protein